MIANEDLIWSDFNLNSDNSQRMIRNKQKNGVDYWDNMREIFKYDCEKLPFNRFRLWASINNVPLVTQYRTARFIGESFYAAARNPDVALALKENWVGIPPGMIHFLSDVCSDFDTSMQRIQNVAHLLITDFVKDISSYKSIIEIGAGYGDMCSVIHSLGFKGKYTIVDLPELQPIQNYYLEKNEITAAFSFEDSDIEPADLVISTWAISETPIEYRNILLPKINSSPNWLILSQDRVFNQENNKTYFKEFFKSMNMKEIPLISDGLATWDGNNTYYVVKK